MKEADFDKQPSDRDGQAGSGAHRISGTDDGEQASRRRIAPAHPATGKSHPQHPWRL
jgi:hypothetical protein